MPQLKGVIKTPTGEPLGGATITLTSLHNRAGILKGVFSHVTTQSGEYDFPVLPGVYSVRLTQSVQRLSEIGVIRVYEDSADGSLNDFLGATDIDLRPEALKKFEELAQQAQQSAEKAGEHADAAEQARLDTETLAGEIRQDAEKIADNVQKAEELASDTAQNAARAEQAVKDADKIVQKAVDKLADAATLTGEAKASAEAAAQSELNAKSHADNAAGNAQQTAQDVTATTAARDDAERFANAAENNAQESGAARDESADAAGRARLYKEAASSAATSAEQSSNVALGHENNAAEYARQAKASQDTSADNAQEAKQHRDEAQRIVDDLNATNATTTQKGLVQLSSDTDSDSEALAATPNAVKAVMDETKTKAPLDSPAFTGTPTTPTPPDDATGLEMANAAFVRKLLAALVGSSPEALDTLNELAAALGNDPNFATTVTNALAGKQPLNDLLTAISNLNERSDNLLYFNQDGDVSLSPLSAKARSLLTQSTAEAMRAELELTASATMAPQSSIYDRTEGRLAMPGAFGYGRMFSLTDVISLETSEDFTEWVKMATPGKYLIFVGESLIPSVPFSGVLEIIWPGVYVPEDEFASKPERQTKVIFFYGNEGAVYHNHYVGGSGGVGLLAGWESLIFDASTVTNALRSTTGNQWDSPGVDGLIIAAYFGDSDSDNNRKLRRGEYVSGSRLGMVAISAKCSTSDTHTSTPQFITVSPDQYPQAGTFIALSGSHLTTTGTDECFVGLFMRVR